MRTIRKTRAVAEIPGISKLITDHSVELEDVSALNKLIEKIGDAKYVLLGEASHGTHEYCTIRAENRYVKNYRTQ